jgi:gas vesicle protein
MRIGRYESSEGGNVGTAITFLLIGLGAGTLIGLLLAPKSGRQLRRDIKRGYEEAKDAVGEWAEETAEKAKDRVREAKERVRGAASRSAEASADLAEDLREAAKEKVEPLRRAVNRG